MNKCLKYLTIIIGLIIALVLIPSFSNGAYNLDNKITFESFPMWSPDVYCIEKGQSLWGGVTLTLEKKVSIDVIGNKVTVLSIDVKRNTVTNNEYIDGDANLTNSRTAKGLKKLCATLIMGEGKPSYDYSIKDEGRYTTQQKLVWTILTDGTDDLQNIVGGNGGYSYDGLSEPKIYDEMHVIFGVYEPIDDDQRLLVIGSMAKSDDPEIVLPFYKRNFNNNPINDSNIKINVEAGDNVKTIDGGVELKNSDGYFGTVSITPTDATKSVKIKVTETVSSNSSFFYRLWEKKEVASETTNFVILAIGYDSSGKITSIIAESGANPKYFIYNDRTDPNKGIDIINEIIPPVQIVLNKVDTENTSINGAPFTVKYEDKDGTIIMEEEEEVENGAIKFTTFQPETTDNFKAIISEGYYQGYKELKSSIVIEYKYNSFSHSWDATLSGSTENESSDNIGDMNKNGVIDDDDITKINELLGENNEIEVDDTNIEHKLADINKDNKINNKDVENLRYIISPKTYYIGDINADGMINIDDVLKAVNDDLDSEQEILADINGDGTFEVEDILRLFNCIDSQFVMPIEFHLGDINKNGVIDNDDITKINELLGENDEIEVEYTDIKYILADVDQNGFINKQDRDIIVLLEKEKIGDFNKNGVFEKEEVLRILKLILKEDEDTSFKGLDINSDGVVDSVDNSIIEGLNIDDHEKELLDLEDDDRILNVEYLEILLKLKEYRLGDVNKDRVINDDDITKINELLGEKDKIEVEYTNIEHILADVDRDGDIDNDDITLVKILGFSYMLGDTDLQRDIEIRDIYYIANRKGTEFKDFKEIGNILADANQDGVINDDDIIETMKFINNNLNKESLINKTINGKDYILGDVDLDGKLTYTDRTIIQKMAADIDGYIYIQDKLSDLNGDGNINNDDVEKLKEIQNKLADVYGDEDINNDDVTTLERKYKFSFISTRILGDVNSDGKITKEDVTKLSKVVKGEESLLTPIQKKLADVYEDGEINEKDEELLSMYVSGISINKVSRDGTLSNSEISWTISSEDGIEKIELTVPNTSIIKKVIINKTDSVGGEAIEGVKFDVNLENGCFEDGTTEKKDVSTNVSGQIESGEIEIVDLSDPLIIKLTETEVPVGYKKLNGDIIIKIKRRNDANGYYYSIDTSDTSNTITDEEFKTNSDVTYNGNDNSFEINIRNIPIMNLGGKVWLDKFNGEYKSRSNKK